MKIEESQQRRDAHPTAGTVGRPGDTRGHNVKIGWKIGMGYVGGLVLTCLAGTWTARNAHNAGRSETCGQRLEATRNTAVSSETARVMADLTNQGLPWNSNPGSS